MKLPMALLASGLLLAGAPASAADKGFFVGAGLGQMNTDVDNYAFDEDDFGFKLFGGYKFLRWLSVEGAYVDGGEPEAKNSGSSGGYSYSERLSIDVQALVATAVFTLPIGDSFELFAKPGIAYWDSTTRYELSVDGLGNDSISLDDSGSAFFLGAGAGFNFNENLGVRVEYEWFEVAPEWDSESDEFVDDLDASSAFLSVSFVYTF